MDLGMRHSSDDRPRSESRDPTHSAAEILEGDRLEKIVSIIIVVVVVVVVVGVDFVVVVVVVKHISC